MRIISGSFKGRKILQPKDNLTRPLKDLTKESIFNLINHSNKINLDFKNSIVLDLFSGVGSFGIECLSRGAKHVVFYENYYGVLPILKINIIFLDPPYKDKNLGSLLKNLKNSNIIDQDGIIILHRHKSEEIDFSDNYKIIEERKYGISKIIFFSLLN